MRYTRGCLVHRQHLQAQPMHIIRYDHHFYIGMGLSCIGHKQPWNIKPKTVVCLILYIYIYTASYCYHGLSVCQYQRVINIISGLTSSIKCL